MSDPTPTPAPEALEPGGMVSTPYGMVPGCPNVPPCLHARIAHDVEDEDDPLPMCCVDGCRCGHDRSQLPGSAPTPAEDPVAFGIVPARSERGGPMDMWAVTYRGQTLSRFDRFGDARADMLDRAGRALRERSAEPAPDTAVASGTVILLPSEAKVIVQAEDRTLVEHGWTATPGQHLQEADEILARRGLERRVPWREHPVLSRTRWTARLYRTVESDRPEADPTSDTAAPRLAPGTYELTKRMVVDADGIARFVDMPDGPDAKYVQGFWHKTRSQVRQVDGPSSASSTRDARNIAEWLDACGAAEPDEDAAARSVAGTPTLEGTWRCERCGSPRWAGWRAGPEHEGFRRFAQCVPCGAVQDLPVTNESGSG